MVQLRGFYYNQNFFETKLQSVKMYLSGISFHTVAEVYKVKTVAYPYIDQKYQKEDRIVLWKRI